MSVTVTADGDAGLADRTSAELAAALWEKRREFLS